MALKFTPSELEQVANDIFESGTPNFRILDLGELKAKEYIESFRALEYNAIPKGPSVEYDPLKKNKRYAVVVFSKGDNQ